jgi:hypothetical protein
MRQCKHKSKVCAMNLIFQIKIFQEILLLLAYISGNFLQGVSYVKRLTKCNKNQLPELNETAVMIKQVSGGGGLFSGFYL